MQTGYRKYNSKREDKNEAYRIVSRDNNVHQNNYKAFKKEEYELKAKITKKFVHYKDAEASFFNVEELLFTYIGDPNFISSFSQVEDYTALLKDKIFINCKQFQHIHYNKQKKKTEKDIILVNDSFLLRISNCLSYTILSLYTTNEKVLEKISKIILEKCVFEPEEKQKGNINVLMSERNELILKPIDQKYPFCFDNYENFSETHNKIIELLKKDRGIFLFYGEPGTGKTNYIKCLPGFAEDKKFIFIPPAFGNTLSEPGFLKFISEHKNSVLIIEDAESILRSREIGVNHAVSNILNLTDGILSELLNIQVICTLNCNINEVDNAVRRPGRLLLEHKFDKLSPEFATKRLQEIHPEAKSIFLSQETTLSDIYNYNVINQIDLKPTKIGFTNYA